MKVRLTAEALDPAALEQIVAAPESGAVVLFLGTVRNHHAGRAVARLTYSAYVKMAEKVLERIVADLEAESPGLRVAIWHRLGEIEVGAASVIIATSSAHRQKAYEASRVALERLKGEVPIWKRERYADGSEAWREEEALLRRRRG